MERLIANVLIFGAFSVLGIVAIAGAVYEPVLGLLHCVAVSAYFFDFNRRVFGRFFVSPKVFINKTKFVDKDHRFLFLVFVSVWIVTLLMVFVRMFD
ncbi:hypothetical protein [Methylophilus sp. Leaf408]|uniref:hypothetical protein n=1 Tax=Methylophilus sp. Leaf408 TaxID=2876561 RepID=UPI001E602720|nr:hypothetical protein [Methylophilus sp. Leaf408]